jgi:hypothetical protein
MWPVCVRAFDRVANSAAPPLFWGGGGGGTDPEAVYNLRLILKIMLLKITL